MGKIKIISDGTGEGSSIIDDETGKQIINVTSVKFELNTEGLVTAHLDVWPSSFEIVLDDDQMSIHEKDVHINKLPIKTIDEMKESLEFNKERYQHYYDKLPPEDRSFPTTAPKKNRADVIRMISHKDNVKLLEWILNMEKDDEDA